MLSSTFQIIPPFWYSLFLKKFHPTPLFAVLQDQQWTEKRGILKFIKKIHIYELTWTNLFKTYSCYEKILSFDKRLSSKIYLEKDPVTPTNGKRIPLLVYVWLLLSIKAEPLRISWGSYLWLRSCIKSMTLSSLISLKILYWITKSKLTEKESFGELRWLTLEELTKFIFKPTTTPPLIISI